MKKEEIFEYVQKQYGTIPEYLWSKLPDSAVLRHKNGKWYAVIMTVEKSKLGLEGRELVDIIDVKCDPDMTNMIIQTYGFLPGYHMNKQHWITILLDGSVSEAKVLDFLDMSYDLIDGAGRKDEYLMTGTIYYTEPRNVQRRFKNILKKCDLPPVTFHSLRHSFATRCIEKGADSKALSEILGHSSVKITLDIYVHSNMEQKREYINQLTI